MRMTEKRRQEMQAAKEAQKRGAQAAKNDFDKELHQARKIDNHWRRCQALAEVARTAPESEVVRVVEEALKTAPLCKDGFQQVAVTYWPLHALIERGKIAQAERFLPPILEKAARIEHPVCKMDALSFLFYCAWRLPTPIRQHVLNDFLSACLAANSWRAGRAMRRVAGVVAEEDQVRAQRIIDSMRDSIYKRRAQRDLDAL